MYTKITRSGGRQYLQLVEGYRNEEGKVRHRVVANLRETVPNFVRDASCYAIGKRSSNMMAS